MARLSNFESNLEAGFLQKALPRKTSTRIQLSPRTQIAVTIDGRNIVLGAPVTYQFDPCVVLGAGKILFFHLVDKGRVGVNPGNEKFNTQRVGVESLGVVASLVVQTASNHHAAGCYEGVSRKAQLASQSTA